MKNQFEVIGVIPARYESTRLEHKLLRHLAGKTILERAWLAAKASHLLDKLIIACDHPKIKEAAEGFGAEVVLTSDKHDCGSGRIAEAVSDIDAAIVVNIQADEPLIHPSVINSLAEEMLSDKSLVMATAKVKIDDKSQVSNPNLVKVICDKDNFAIYFSRGVIPYQRDRGPEGVYYKHLGIYAYTKDFLYDYKNLPVSYLESAEKLEQLRVLEAGHKIKVIETRFNSWSVDTQEDLDFLENMISQKGL